MASAVLVFEEDVLRVICGYAPQSGRLEEKQPFYELKNECNMHRVDDTVVCFGDFNGHVGSHIDGFLGVHGRHCVGRKYFKRMRH